MFVCAQAKGKERQWLKNQALGELDDAKIIDGLAGEKAVYKRRGEQDPEVCSCVLAGALACQCTHLLILNPHFGVFPPPPPHPPHSPMFLRSHASKNIQTRLTHIILTFICQTLHSSGVRERYDACISAQTRTRCRGFFPLSVIYGGVNKDILSLPVEHVITLYYRPIKA